MLGAAISIVFLCMSCVQAGSVVCDNGRVCPAGYTCTLSGCALPDELQACSGVPDGELCTASRGNGVCRDGACQTSSCGNGIIEGKEACDDGNQLGRDGCNGTCTSTEVCGNGILELEEQCDCGIDDDGDDALPCGTTINGGDVCSESCTPRRCGDGVIDPGEVCDDSNAVAGDGCNFDCTSLEVCGNGIVDYFSEELCDDGNIRDRDGCDGVCGVERLVWRLNAQNTTVARYRHSAAYDIARRRMVIFGGYNSQGAGFPIGGTWELDGTTWTERVTDTLPPVRSGAAMAYDPRRARIVMFGGSTNNGGGYRDDSWEYDGVNWTELTPTTKPPPREYGAMVYDGERKKLVLFGGLRSVNNVTTRLDDVWEFDGTTWTPLATTNPPSARYGHAMVFDAARGRIVVFGGNDTTNTDAVTYLLDGTTWTTFDPTTKPQGRVYPGMVYEASTGKIVLHGGYQSGVSSTETWEYNGSSWAPRTTNTPPIGRLQPVFVHDPISSRTYLHGGAPGASSPVGETWALDAATWTPIAAVQPVIGRQRAAVAYDGSRARTVMFGGFSNNSTWVFEGRAWRDLVPSNPPANHWDHAMAYDAGRDKVVMFGGVGANTTFGLYDDTYELTGSSWQLVSNLQTKPAGRASHAMAYDPVRRRTVMFGGWTSINESAETWEYDGTNWVMITPSGAAPAGRSNCTMVYDASRGAMVMFGGKANGTPLDDTWTYDGTSWTMLTPVQRPTPREAHTMVYDAARNRIVMFGGVAEGMDFDDLWELDNPTELDDATWREIQGSSFVVRPTQRTDHVMAYDAAQNLTFVHTGILTNGGSGPNSETWILELPQKRVAEACTSSSDYDDDTKVGCADDECWGVCSPLCSPDTPTANCATYARCGDGVCGSIENCRGCPQDCATNTAACPLRCGDFYCDATETANACPGDCL